MTDESLADTVGAHLESEETGVDPRLDRLSQGTLSERERAELEREAQDDVALAEAIRIFTPASAPELDRLVAVATQTASAGRVRRIGLRLLVVPVAAAAAILFLTLSGPVPLPEMTMALTAGDRSLRGAVTEEGDLRIVAPDSMITLGLRPDVAVEGPVEAGLFAISEGRAHRIDLRIRTSQDGAVRVRGPAQRLAGIDRGAATIVLVVARPGRLPQPEQLVEGSNSTGDYAGPGWHVAQVQVVLQPVRAKPPAN